MMTNIHRRETNKLVLYGLLLMMLVIGITGPLLPTQDDDENLGITFLETKIVGHDDVGKNFHLAPAAVLIVTQMFDFDVKDFVGTLQSPQSAKFGPAVLAIPLRT